MLRSGCGRMRKEERGRTDLSFLFFLPRDMTGINSASLSLFLLSISFFLFLLSPPSSGSLLCTFSLERGIEMRTRKKKKKKKKKRIRK